MPADVRIRKQKFVVKTNDERVAVRCRQIIATLITSELQPLYERIFNQQEENSTSYLNLGKLQIDLGKMTEKEIEMNFINALEVQIRNVLEQLLEQSPVSNHPTGPFDQHTTQNAQGTSPVTYNSKSRQNVEVLQHYLEKGHYPWWMAQQTSVSPNVLYGTLSNAERDQLLLFLIRNFEHWTDVRREAAVKRMLTTVDNVSAVDAARMIEQLCKLFSNDALEKNVKTLLENGPHFSEVFAIKLRMIYNKLVYTILNIETHESIIKRFVESLFRDYKVTDAQAFQKLMRDQYPLMSTAAMQESDNEAIHVPNQTSTTSKLNGKSNTDKVEIYIQNAGLIILHPFLASFFSILGLTNTLNQFNNFEDQRLAAVILHYLQTGNTSYKEWEMTLNKVLCGLDPSDAIDEDISIPEHAVQESKLLLKELIENWTALKGSSIESVQHSFFARPGKLSFNGTAWLLQVERTAMDVLVDRLPWGLSVLRLPWNKQLIYTEW